jgi:hypothetical protein
VNTFNNKSVLNVKSLLDTCVLYIRKNPSLFDYEKIPSDLIIKFFKLYKIEKLLRNDIEEININSVNIEKVEDKLFLKVSNDKGITRPFKFVYFKSLTERYFGERYISIDYTFNKGRFYIQQSFLSHDKKINYYELEEEYLPFYDKELKEINIEKINNILNFKHYIYSNLKYPNSENISILDKYPKKIIEKILKPSIIEETFHKTKVDIYWCLISEYNKTYLVVKFENNKLECECTKYECFNCKLNKTKFNNYGFIKIYKNFNTGGTYILDVKMENKELKFLKHSFYRDMSRKTLQIYVNKNIGITEIRNNL